MEILGRDDDEEQRARRGRDPGTGPGRLPPALDLGVVPQTRERSRAVDRPTRGRSADPDPDAAADAEPGPPDGSDVEEPDRPSPRALLLSSEALGLAGVLVAVLTPVVDLPLLVSIDPRGYSRRSQLEAVAFSHAAGGVLALALGVLAMVRMDPRPSATARALAGAAPLLGALLLLLAGYLAVTSAGLPTTG